MALTPEERQKVIAMLDDMDERKKQKTLSSFDSFVNWLRNELYSVYYKIRDSLYNLWRNLTSWF